MDAEIFNRFRDLIYRNSGIALADEKRDLLNGRIRKRLAQLQLHEPLDYLQVIESDLSGQELVLLLDAISTNTTYFHREPRHFEIYAEMLRSYRAEGRRQVKVWCAAASTGEEPYTLAMIASDTLDLKVQTAKVLATDISTRALGRAVEGIYPLASVAKLPEQLRNRHFVRADSEEQQMCQVHPEIRRMVLFKRLNLVEFPYPLQGAVDIIFCRNVMIYFDIPVRERVIHEFTRLLAPGGFLFLSHSENLLGIQHELGRYDTSVFQKKGGGKR